MLRTEVFVDEPKIDEVDLEPFTELHWIEDDAGVVVVVVATRRFIEDGAPAISAGLPRRARLVVGSRRISSRPLWPRPRLCSRDQCTHTSKIVMLDLDSRA